MIDKNLIIRRIICAAVSFVLSVCLACFALVLTAYIASDKAYLSYAEEKSNYAELSLVTLKTELEDLTIPAEFPLDFFDSRINEETYKQRVAESFTANINGTPLSYNIDSVSNEFYDMIRSYVLEEDGEIADGIEEGLRGLSLECAKIYVKYSNPSSVKLVVKYFPSIRKALVYAAVIAAVLLSAAAFFLVKLCYGRDLIKHIVFAFGGAFLLVGVFPAILLFTREVEKISLTLPALHSFAVTFIEGILMMLCIISAIFLLATLTLAAINIIKYIKAEKTSE